MDTSATRQSYRRFSLAQRLEHWLMSLSFTVLVVTGLPQRYARAAWAEVMIDLMGGIEAVRIIHRLAAIVFMLVMVYHVVVVAYKLYVLRVEWTMVPTLKDGRDMIDALGYYLGRRATHPKMPRYNYAEKIEYWAVIWGGVLMTITGFMLWNPIATTNFFPGEFVPAARAAHSAEALLAFLAIIIWHVYWVHLKTFNRSIFTGKLSRAQMEAEHMAELEAIEAGQVWSPPAQPLRQQRARRFMPISGLGTTLVLIALYFFVTFEQTAITTIPPAELSVAFIPATPTPTSTPLPTPTPIATPLNGETVPVMVSMISHPLGGREECFECHGADGPVPNPANHGDYELKSCQVCHDPLVDKLGPGPITHKLVERAECSRCHELDLLPESHGQAAFKDRECLLCHAIR
jgi:formate dehydrogenase gamma subunit